MTFSPAPSVPAPKAPGTGVSMSLQVAKTRSSVRLILTEDAQKTIFGDRLDPEKDKADVLIGRGEHEGFLQLRISPEGEHAISKGVRGSVNIRVGRWDLLPQDKRPAGPCKPQGGMEVHGDARVIHLELPDWANPKKRPNRFADEFKLKGTEAGGRK